MKILQLIFFLSRVPSFPLQGNDLTISRLQGHACLKKEKIKRIIPGGILNFILAGDGCADKHQLSNFSCPELTGLFRVTKFSSRLTTS